MDTRITTGEFRKNLADVINRAQYTDERFVITRNGKAIAALISFEELSLLDELEDLHDQEIVDERLASPDPSPSTLEEVRAELGLDQVEGKEAA